MTTDTFGDYEPEDAWDADDPTPLLLENLSRRCVALGEPPVPAYADPIEWVDEIAERVTAIFHRPRLSPTERLRAELIADDIEYLRETRLDVD